MRSVCRFVLTGVVVFALDFVLRTAGAEPTDKKMADPAIFINGMPARSIGPANMGGRVTDIEVVESNTKVIYVAAASGGVWKTIDGGDTWQSIFDREGVASIGDIAVSPSNPDIVWVGTGEANARNSVSWGDGVYKSENGGRTWQHMGLKETRHIGRVVIHPRNSDIVYVAALGHLWGPNPERGLYRTTDGGKTWKKSKYIDVNTGFIDAAMDPADPNTLYAAAYHVRRDAFAGGNPASQFRNSADLFKTTDGGDTWEKITNGLPDRPLGRCGFAVYRKDPNIVYAVIQTDRTSLAPGGQPAKENADIDTGGVFRSEDKGKTWKKLNNLCPRPFYYGQIRVDPADDQRVYILGIALHVSDDGGKSFPQQLTARGVHPDHHALWINPTDPKHLILGNDGGLYFSKDRGQTWEPVRNLPIGQFYGVAADMRQPYHVYGGLQDNGSWGGPTATFSAAGITLFDWKRIAGGDGFQCAADPTDSNTVYAEGQFGRLQRITLGPRFGAKPITPRPERSASPYRFNWDAPLLLCPHDSKTIYFGGNYLFKSIDRGDKWEVISPDLTRARPFAPAYGHTLTTIAESPRKAGVLWAGADDGKVQVSKNAGKDWTDVSEKIPCHPHARWISRIECSHFDEGTAYVSIDRHRNDDLRPYLFKTTDFGATWQALAANLPAEEPLHVVRQSSRNPDLLFAGSECGLYVTLDGGHEWHRYRGLPTVPVFDLVIHPRDRELVIGTHGRSVYVMDIAPLEELTEAVQRGDLHLFAVKPAVAYEPRKLEITHHARTFRAPNPPIGASICYYLRSDRAKPVSLAITGNEGQKIAALQGPAEAGFHRIYWNLRAGADQPLIEPGSYNLTLDVDGKQLKQKIEVRKPP